jgi:hypothetical protein
MASRGLSLIFDTGEQEGECGYCKGANGPHSCSHGALVASWFFAVLRCARCVRCCTPRCARPDENANAHTTQHPRNENNQACTRTA